MYEYDVIIKAGRGTDVGRADTPRRIPVVFNELIVECSPITDTDIDVILVIKSANRVYTTSFNH